MNDFLFLFASKNFIAMLLLFLLGLKILAVLAGDFMFDN